MVNRRDLLKTAAAASATVALGTTTWQQMPRGAAARRRAAGAQLGGQADALGPAHPRRGRPGQVRPAILARLLRSRPNPTRSVSARAAASRITRRRSPSTTAARGWASATCSASWWPVAASSAWSSSPAPTRTRLTTMCARRTPTGLPWTPTASRAGTGPRPRCGSPAGSAPTISSS